MAGPTNASSGRSGRLYTHPISQETAVSVTTILNQGIPKPALTGWASKMAATYAVEHIDELRGLIKQGGESRLEALDRIKGAPWRNRDNAADRGTAVHDIGEAMGLGDLDPADVDLSDYDDEIRGYVQSLVRWWDAFRPKVEATEVTVWSRQYQYAGTLDLIATIDLPEIEGIWPGGPARMLADYKTSKGVYGEVGLQLTAYANAEFALLDDGTEAELPPVDLGGVIHILPDGKPAKLHPIALTDDLWSYFLYAREVADWSREGSKTAVGKPISPNR